MPTTSSFQSHPLIRKLEGSLSLSNDETRILIDLPIQAVNLKAGQDITREGDRPSRACVVLEGYVCVYKVTGGGKRQIQAFHIPGDSPDLQCLHLKVMDSTVGALTACKVGFVPHEVLHALCERHPRIAAALWRNTLAEAAIFREWVTNIGRRESYYRIAHFLCEWVVRLREAGLAVGNNCQLPMSQGDLADALGLTTVHVNRVLQKLRADGLIETRGPWLTIPDWERLMEVGDFDPTYLHLGRAAAA